MRPSFTVLALCSDMLLLCAMVIGGNTTWGLLRMSYYFWTTHLGVELASCALLIAAALLSLPVCYVVLVGIQRPNVKIVPFYITILCLVSSSLILTAMGITSMTGLLQSVKSSRLNESMSRAMTHVATDPMVYASFTSMQTELKCCGVRSYKDWYSYRSSLPPSCCGIGLQQSKRNFTRCNVPVYTKGCYYAAQAELGSFLSAISVYSASGIIIMAMTLLVTGYMFVTEKDEVGDGKLGSSVRLACLPSTLYQATSPPAPLVNTVTTPTFI